MKGYKKKKTYWIKLKRKTVKADLRVMIVRFLIKEKVIKRKKMKV